MTLRRRALSPESLALCQELENRWGLAEALEGVAHLATSHGQAATAARRFEAAERMRETIGRFHHPHERADFLQGVTAARAALGEPVFAAAWAEGRALTVDQAVRLAVEQSAT